MKWRECKLGDVLTLKRGHDLPADSRKEGDIPVVSSAGITGFHNEACAVAPGVVTGRYGTIGEVYFLEQDYWPLNTALYVIDFKGSDPKFTAYFLRQILRGYQSDKAAVPGVDRNVLHEIKVRAPDRKTQQRIAETLSAYDDLMENNRRRMALLEESARVLYREWFVRRRFLGHEKASAKNGPPNGWAQIRLGDVLTLKRGYDLPSASRTDGEIPIVSSSGITGFHSEKKADAPGVVTGRYGTLGEVYFIDQDYWPLNTALYVSDFKGHSALFILHLLKHELQSIQSDKAAIPGLNRNVIHERSILYPPKSLRERFTEFVEPIYRQLGVLNSANQKLRTARDHLLPRLMNGELAV